LNIFINEPIYSTCGFAAGFDQESTKFRSLCEGVERWAWSKWIDDKYIISSCPAPRLHGLGEYFHGFFESTLFFQKKISMKNSPLQQDLIFNVVLGFTKDGVFPGSRVTTVSDDLWTHALLEAWRNYNNFQFLQNQTSDNLNWLDKRVLYFGKNKNEAMSQIESAYRYDWQNPEIKFFNGVEFFKKNFLWRTVIQNYIPWPEGPKSRFVY